MSYTHNDTPQRSCPDDGHCHHGCPSDPAIEPCFRTLWCAPFSNYNGGTQDAVRDLARVAGMYVITMDAIGGMATVVTAIQSAKVTVR